LLTAPSLSALTDAVGGTLVSGDPALLAREVRSVLVGAMTVDHLLTRLDEAALVITPGDRTDAIVALLAAHGADGFPSLSGIMLSGGLQPDSTVSTLLAGLGSSLPIVATGVGTYEAANACSTTRGRLSSDSN